MSFEDTIAEMKRHREAKELQNRIEEQEKTIVDNIRHIITPEQLKGWQVVESLILGSISRSDIYISDERIREKLKQKDCVDNRGVRNDHRLPIDDREKHTCNTMLW